ncbi:hypothetical protein PV08_00200 [Exophiala spinifera]|uniref:Uncharacterized protein n=1 Tax=Exophiala spinifera TaxID=91928 RepID=A0A0D2A451_9EURO|nr:uncharacterized protein PV08_00200 [Exophiala spinifera]KIW19627.1 hypothetical protein PV08_00200 [Exophiala spinifera]
MISDRKATVGCAVDLLRAHQLRRENAHLHRQTQAYHDELICTRAEVKELKIIVRGYQADRASSQSLRKLYEARSDEQAAQIRCLRGDLEMLKAETAKHEGEVARYCADTVPERRMLEERLSRIETLFQHAAEASKSHFQTVDARLEGLETGLQSKADAALVEHIHLLTGPIQPPDASLDSVSRVNNSVEVANPLLQEHTGIQVHDSQRTYLPERSANPALNPHHDAATKPAVQSSIPSDLDLDENVNTVSYAGHRILSVDDNDSLSFLSECRAPANELTRANNLTQEKFESWEHYYSRAHSLVQALPATFEEMVVRRFADGLFKTVQRKQCRQWLELKGWTWENVDSFGDISSQIPEAPSSTLAPSAEISARYSKKMGPLLEKKRSTAKRASNAPGRVPTGNNDTRMMPLRRSQRLIEKGNRTAMEAAEKPAKSESQVLGDSYRKNMSISSSQKRKALKEKASGPKQGRGHESTKTGRASGGKDTGHAKAIAGHNPAVTRAQGIDDGMEEAQSPAGCKENERVGQRSCQQEPTKGNSKQPRGGISCVPRLVPQKRALTGAASESSGDEGYLYEQRIKHNNAQEMPVTKHRRVAHRLPLPPPPEIPILSTSSEG